MVRISDPMQIQNPGLRQFAFQAAFLAKLAESIGDLEDLYFGSGPVIGVHLIARHPLPITHHPNSLSLCHPVTPTPLRC